MASPRELRDRDLDAAGHAVTGLPTSVNASDAVRRDEMLAGDATNAAAIAAEAAARAAADALIPGTIIALTGDVTASGTGAVPATIANLPQAVLLTRTGSLTADLPVNNHKITGLASGGATPTNAANIGDILAQAALSVADETALAALDATNLGTGTRVWVQTYRCFWTLDKSTTRTALGNLVRTASGGSGWWWVRQLAQGDPFWQAQTDWYIDPAGTNSTPGDDEADGLSSSTPIKSLAEWRRRIQGATYNVNGTTIHALSGSTNPDDGLFTGFSTRDDSQFTWVRVLGTPIPTGVSGTVGSYVPYSGNTRGQFTDSALPVSWTASGAVSSPSGSRWARKVGSGVRHYAPLLKDLGSKTVQFGHVVDWDETDPVTARTTETNFANGDAYEVVSFLTWPPPQAMTGSVVMQCLDMGGYGSPDFPVSYGNGMNLHHHLCGFPNNYFFLKGAGQTVIYSAVFCAPSPSGASLNSFFLYLTNCSAVNTILEFSAGAYALSTTSVILVTSEFRGWHGAAFGTMGNLRCFDCTQPIVNLRHMSIGRAVGAIVGSGNTGSLVNCDTGGIFYGAAAISCTTSKALPYTVNLVDYASPTVDVGSGDGIYS